MAVASFETMEALRKVLKDVTPVLDEKQRRILFGSAAEALGYGGIAFVNEVTGSARNTILAGMNDIGQEHGDRIRKEGGGRKSKLEKNPLLLETIEEIVMESNILQSHESAVLDHPFPQRDSFDTEGKVWL